MIIESDSEDYVYSSKELLKVLQEDKEGGNNNKPKEIDKDKGYSLVANKALNLNRKNQKVLVNSIDDKNSKKMDDKFEFPDLEMDGE